MVERIEINLLPAEYRIHSRKFRMQREIIYPVAGLLALSVILMLSTFIMDNKVQQYTNEIAALEQQILQNKPIQKEIQRLREDKQMIQEKIRALERISVNREKWVRLMEILSKDLPPFTWLTSVKEEIGESPMVHIDGKTYSFSAVADYMIDLEKSDYINGVDVAYIEKVNSDDGSFNFSVSCYINRDVNIALHFQHADE